MPLAVNRGKQDLTAEDRAYLRTFGTAKLLKVYKPIFTDEERSQVMGAMKVLTDALDKANVDYFLYGGSLIGAYRHHDIVPWDDDLDIIVNISSWQAVENIKIPGYTLNIRTLNRYKFYHNNATHVPRYFWKWPFIDVNFFGDNGTHLHDMDPTFSKTFVYDKKDVFPLVRRPLGNLMLKSPRDTEKVIAHNYDANICQTRLRDHSREKVYARKDISSVDCRLLYRIFPFVIRDGKTTGPTERVYLDGKLVRSVDLHSI